MVTSFHSLMRYIFQLPITSLSEKCLTIMVIYLCRISKQTIDNDKESSILCDFCNSWIHPKCNHLNFFDFQHISGNNRDPWLCFKKTPDISFRKPQQSTFSFVHS